jgi:hypothetical protein
MATPAPPSTPTPPSQPPVEILYAVPVGTVITWYPPPTAFKADPNNANAPKTLVFPPGFALCDGSVVNDPGSPFNGTSLPNLVNMFILGSGGNIACGDVGGDAQLNTGGWGNPMFVTSPTEASVADNQYNNIIQRSDPSYSAWRYELTQDDLSWNDGNHHHYVPDNTFTVPAPGYVALIMIMRIK